MSGAAKNKGQNQAKDTKPSLLEVFSIGWNMMERPEKTKTAILAFSNVVIRSIDIAALMCVVPFVSLTIKPDSEFATKTFSIAKDYLPAHLANNILYLIGITVIVLLATASTLTISLNYMIARHATNCQVRMTKEISEKYLHAPISWIITQNSAALTRIVGTDVGAWSVNFLEGLINSTGNLATLILALSLVVYSTPLSGVLSLFIFGAIAGVLFLFTKPKIREHAHKFRASMISLTTLMTQIIGGARDIKISSTTYYFSSMCTKHTADAVNSRVYSQLWRTISPTLLLLLSQIAIVTIASIFVWLQIDSSTITTQLTIMLLVISRLAPALTNISTGSTRLLEATPSLLGILNIRQTLAEFETPKHYESKLPDQWNSIQLRNASYQYPNASFHSLSDVTLSIEHNKSYGIVGPSGAGKSTLVDLILGLQTPTEGEVLVNDVKLKTIDPQSWYSKIGYVPQSPFIIDDTLRANVAFGIARDDIDDNKVWECLRAVYLDDLIDRMPDGLDSSLGERGFLVSGGQRQRIAIARALYMSPDILILDEATSALDSITERAIHKMMRNLKASMTFIVIAHNINSIKDVDSFVLLNDGKLEAMGTYKHLSETSSLFRELAARKDTDTFVPHPAT